MSNTKGREYGEIHITALLTTVKLTLRRTFVTRPFNRKQPRIPYQGKVDLFFPDRRYLGCTVQNLSLIGMWVLGGCRDQGEEGGECDIEFHDTVSGANHQLRMRGEVVRADDEGIALIFLNMNVRTYNDLEALILEQGGPPLMEENEFLDGLPA